MADFVDRIKLIYSVTADQAKSGFSDVKQGVNEAEGAFGKLKAGAGGALDLIGQNAALSAGAAGLAIGKFVSDAIGHFQELALEANNLGDAVGLSAEDASRWIEVAGDLGVNVETLQGAVQKLNVATAGGVLDKLGVGGDTTNERLLNALQHLQSIPNAADRAKEGVQLFGKSWTALSPLVETAGDLRSRLAAVSDEKVINEAEIAKAKELRDAFDRLSDVWDSFVLAIGGSAISTVASFANGLGNLAESAQALAEATGGLADIGDAFSLLNPLSQLQNLGSAFESATDSSKGFLERAEGVGSALANNIPVVGGWVGGLFGADDAQKAAKQSAADLAESQKAAAAAAEEQAKQTAEAEKALRSMNDAALAAFNSTLGLADATDKTSDAMATYAEKNQAAADAGYGNAAANDEARRALNDAEQAALAQAAAAAKLDADNRAAAGGAQTLADKNSVMANTLETIAGTLDPASPLYRNLMGYAHQLESLPTDASTTINADTSDAQSKVNQLTNSIYSIVGRIFHVNVQANVGGGTGGGSASSWSAPTAAGPTVGLRAVPAGPVAAPVTNINVAVTVPVGTPTAEVGRYVADALVLHQRRVGSQRVA